MPTIPQDEERQKTVHPKEKHFFSDATEKEEKLIGTQLLKSNSKLEALFKHPLYNLPHPEVQEDDWLLRVKPDEKAKDTGSEEKEREDAIIIDSEW